jgi:S-adenosylmethionine-dependent methyltransferase
MHDPYAALAAPFLAHYKTLRGVVRSALVARQLDAHMPAPPALVADIGGGAGHQAIRLAGLGYEVSLLDPSREMLDRAQEALMAEDARVRDRVRLVHASGEESPRILGSGRFDAVLCHGVLMYVDAPAALIAALAAIVRPGGLVSILTKNAAALAMRPALEGRFRDALDAFEADRDVGGLGVATTAHTLRGLAAQLEAHGLDLAAWYGVRVFTDHLGDRPPGPDDRAVLAAEWEAGRRDPYRAVARLLHVLAIAHPA